MFRSCRMMAATAVALLAIALAAGTADARSGHSPRGGGGNAAPVPATAVLDWNATAVATVRGAMPAKFQIEGDLYMSYVQAAVYDAVVSIAGRYEPYHAFATPVSPRGASIPAAVAAAAYTALAYYFPPQAATLQTTYTAYLAALPSAGQAAGDASAVSAVTPVSLRKNTWSSMVTSSASETTRIDVGCSMP